MSVFLTVPGFLVLVIGLGSGAALAPAAFIAGLVVRPPLAKLLSNLRRIIRWRR